MGEGKEARIELIETCGCPSEILEFEEEALHEMTFIVKPPIDALPSRWMLSHAGISEELQEQLRRIVEGEWGIRGVRKQC